MPDVELSVVKRMTVVAHQCPYCDGKDLKIIHKIYPWPETRDSKGFSVIECQSCGVSGPRAASEAEAVEQWNYLCKVTGGGV